MLDDNLPYSLIKHSILVIICNFFDENHRVETKTIVLLLCCCCCVTLRVPPWIMKFCFIETDDETRQNMQAKKGAAGAKRRPA